MNSRTNFLIVLISLILLIPGFSFGDGGMVIWPPDVYLDQSAQNAICAWNGKKEGRFESFETLAKIMNKKLEAVREEW